MAHKIEDLADEDIRHGEAVAVSIALDCLYSHYFGLISELELYTILSLLSAIGFDLYHPVLHKMDLIASLNDFREHMGGELIIPLFDGLGSLVEVHEIQGELMNKGIEFLAARSRRKGTPHERKDQSHDSPGSIGQVLP